MTLAELCQERKTATAFMLTDKNKQFRKGLYLEI